MNSADGSIKNYQLHQNSLEDILIIDSYQKQDEPFKTNNMEFLMPYTRQKPPTLAGMQLLSIKKFEPTNISTINHISTVSDGHLDNKKHQKQIYQQPKLLKNASDVECMPRKMSKKQLKLAQQQLKKLTKINIHLHGTYFHF